MEIMMAWHAIACVNKNMDPVIQASIHKELWKAVPLLIGAAIIGSVVGLVFLIIEKNLFEWITGKKWKPPRNRRF